MKNMKKSLSVFLAASMLISSMVAVSAETAPDWLLANDVTSGMDSGLAETTPAENLFTVGGKEYILLDTDESSETSRYFVLTDDSIGGYCYYGNQKFDPNNSDKGVLPYRLNHDYILSGDGYHDAAWTDAGQTLDSSLIKYLDKNHVWWTEEGHADGGAPEAYSFTAGVTIPSYTEVKTYASKIGNRGGRDWLMLRTGSKEISDHMIRINWQGLLLTNEMNVGWVGQVYPCFWLGEGFFANTKLDISKAGGNVIAEIAKATEDELLAAGYTADEIASIMEYAPEPELKAPEWLLENNVTSFVSTNMPSVTPAENKFKLNGKEYILLDTDEASESSRYFVLTDYSIGSYPMYGNQVFNPESSDKGLLACRLNNDFILSGNAYLDNSWIDAGMVLDEALRTHLDKEHLWWTEVAHADGAAKPYWFKAAVTLPSYTEVITYASKIGYGTPSRDWARLRTGSPSSASHSLRITWQGNIENNLSVTDANVIFPCFWLDKDVFKEAKLDLSATGANVLTELKKLSKEELLSAGYTETEIASLISGTITGNLAVGQTLTANPVANAESYAWCRADSMEGPWEAIADETSQTYIIKNADKGKWLKADVISGENVVASIYTLSNVITTQSNTMTEWTSLGQPAVTPVENKFTLASDTTKSYILLESTDDETATFFILSDFSAKHTPWYESQKFNVESADTGILPVRLNIDYIGQTNPRGDTWSERINPDFDAYLDKNHVWETENGAFDGIIPEDYTFTAAVTMPSLTEMTKYASKIGYEGFDWAWLRTGSVLDKNMVLRQTWDGLIANNISISSPGYVRPCFWLGEDFFKNVKLDLATTGENVKAMIRERYKPSELVNVYDVDEIASLGYELGVYNAVYTGADGKAVDKLSDAGTTIKLTADIVNGATESGYSVVMALYDATGAMITTDVEASTLTANQEKPVELTIDLSKYNVGNDWKVVTFFWNGLKAMKPITNSYRISY